MKLIINKFQTSHSTKSMDKSYLSILDVGTKAQSKSELNRALVVEGGLYLPPMKEATMLFVSQIAAGDKKVFLLCSSCIHIIHLGIAC